MLLALLHLHGRNREDRVNDLKDVLFNTIDGNALTSIDRGIIETLVKRYDALA